MIPRRVPNLLAMTAAMVALAACGSRTAYWRGDPTRDAAAASARGEYAPIALRDGDSLLVPGLPDSLRGVSLNMTMGRIDSVTLASVRPAQRDSVIRYAATYNAPIFQGILRHRATHLRPPR